MILRSLFSTGLPFSQLPLCCSLSFNKIEWANQNELRPRPRKPKKKTIFSNFVVLFRQLLAEAKEKMCRNHFLLLLSNGKTIPDAENDQVTYRFALSLCSFWRCATARWNETRKKTAKTAKRLAPQWTSKKKEKLCTRSTNQTLEKCASDWAMVIKYFRS